MVQTLSIDAMTNTQTYTYTHFYTLTNTKSDDDINIKLLCGWCCCFFFIPFSNQYLDYVEKQFYIASNIVDDDNDFAVAALHSAIL